MLKRLFATSKSCFAAASNITKSITTMRTKCCPHVRSCDSNRFHLITASVSELIPSLHPGMKCLVAMALRNDPDSNHSLPGSSARTKGINPRASQKNLSSGLQNVSQTARFPKLKQALFKRQAFPIDNNQGSYSRCPLTKRGMKGIGRHTPYPLMGRLILASDPERDALKRKKLTYGIFVTLAACGPFCPWTMSNST